MTPRRRKRAIALANLERAWAACRARRRESHCGERLHYLRGCRCEPCTEANRVATAEHRRRYGVKRTPAQRAAERRYRAKLRLRTIIPGARVVGRRVNICRDDD